MSWLTYLFVGSSFFLTYRYNIFYTKYSPFFLFFANSKYSDTIETLWESDVLLRSLKHQKMIVKKERMFICSQQVKFRRDLFITILNLSIMIIKIHKHFVYKLYNLKIARIYTFPKYLKIFSEYKDKFIILFILHSGSRLYFQTLKVIYS